MGGQIMTKLNLLRLKNALLSANIISNTVGILVIVFILRGAGDLITPEVLKLATRIHIFFLPLSLLIPLNYFYTTILLFYLNHHHPETLLKLLSFPLRSVAVIT